MGEVKVPIRAELPGDVYRALEKVARKRHTTVGEILADLARRAVYPAPVAVRPHRSTGRPVGRPTAVTAAKMVTLKRLHREKATDGQIAVALGVSESAVRRARQRAELPPNHRNVPVRTNGKLSADDLTTVRVLLAEGVSNRQIADRYGVSKALISMIRNGKRHTIERKDAA